MKKWRIDELVNSANGIKNSKITGSQFKKPASAGNAGFRKHNKMKFMKTERMRKLNKR